MIRNSSQIYKNALLIGGSGKLGSEIAKSKYFKNIDAPTKKFLNLKNKKQIKRYLSRDINLVINCSGYTEIRKCEKDGNFGDEFTQLARSVYITNDKRFQTKNNINAFFSSGIVEEKDYEDY